MIIQCCHFIIQLYKLSIIWFTFDYLTEFFSFIKSCLNNLRVNFRSIIINNFLQIKNRLVYSILKLLQNSQIGKSRINNILRTNFFNLQIMISVFLNTKIAIIFIFFHAIKFNFIFRMVCAHEFYLLFFYFCIETNSKIF